VIPRRCNPRHSAPAPRSGDRTASESPDFAREPFEKLQALQDRALSAMNVTAGPAIFRGHTNFRGLQILAICRFS
jgi:hypothetical protein